MEGAIRDADHHARNFLDCVKCRKAPNCEAELGHRCTTAALIAGIAHRRRAVLEWDAKGERFTNSAAANKELATVYRKPYTFPA